jgi:hypothetical protein
MGLGGTGGRGEMERWPAVAADCLEQGGRDVEGRPAAEIWSKEERNREISERATRDKT